MTGTLQPRGAVAFYTCKPGFVMVGASSTFCTDDKTWSAPPICSPARPNYPQGQDQSSNGQSGSQGWEPITRPSTISTMWPPQNWPPGYPTPGSNGSTTFAPYQPPQTTTVSYSNNNNNDYGNGGYDYGGYDDGAHGNGGNNNGAYDDNQNNNGNHDNYYDTNGDGNHDNYYDTYDRTTPFVTFKVPTTLTTTTIGNSDQHPGSDTTVNYVDHHQTEPSDNGNYDECEDENLATRNPECDYSDDVTAQSTPTSQQQQQQQQQQQGSNSGGSSIDFQFDRGKVVLLKKKPRQAEILGIVMFMSYMQLSFKICSS